MAQQRQCPQCSSELPPDAPEGICPKCLLDIGLGPQQDSPSGPQSEQTSPYSARFQPPPPEQLAEHFPQLEIIELIGIGGMGAVYKARQPGLDRLVALKILPPEVGRDPAFAERFAREARALARLSHPSIVVVHDSGHLGGFYYFVMEFVEGANLRQLIATGRLEPQQALAIVPQICEALQYAHDEGIVHRDIKPENVLVDGKGRVKIADFGLAKLLGRAPADFTLTGTQQVMGTPHYMAPEQMERPQQVDHRADIYSLGVVFYEMLTGELPIGRFAPPSKKVQVDVRLDEVVLRALEKEPELRYQSVSQIQTDMASVQSGVGPAAEPAAGPSLGTRLLAVAVVSALFAAFYAAGRGPLEKAGISPVILWLLVVLFVVIPNIVAARCFRASKLGPHLKYSAIFLGVMVVWMPLFFLISGFATDPQPTLDWLYRATGATPGEHDAAVIGALRTAGWVVFLGICLYGYWVLFRILRDRRRQRQADRVRAEQGATGPDAQPATPRFSRKAILGAVWAAFFFVAILPSIFGTQTTYVQPPTSGPESSSPSSSQSQPEPAHDGRALWQWVLIFTLLPLGATAPFGATILGAVSLGEIRHSGGRLIGLPLALADVLLFPLLLLDAIICFACYYPVATIRSIEEFVPLAIVVGLLISVAVDVLIVFWAWRGAVRSG